MSTGWRQMSTGWQQTSTGWRNVSTVWKHLKIDERSQIAFAEKHQETIQKTEWQFLKSIPNH